MHEPRERFIAEHLRPTLADRAVVQYEIESNGMVTVEASDVVDRSAEDVWAELATFGDVARLFTNVTEVRVEGEGIGMRRVLVLEDGTTTMSELTELDHDRRTLRYAIVETGLPLTDYTARIVVEPVREGRCRVTWASTCRPLPGHQDEVRRLLDVQLNNSVTALGGV